MATRSTMQWMESPITQSNGLSVQQERVKSIMEDDIEITSNLYGVNLTQLDTIAEDNDKKGIVDVIMLLIIILTFECLF